MATSRAFRAKLSEELPKWTEEGLVSPETAELLRRRYHLDEDGGSFAALAVYLLGALLVGGGVISFIAWNWAHLPDLLKLSGGVILLVATQGAGYWLWRGTERRPGLGHGLVFLGVVLFGANLGLFAQVYNIHDHWRGGIGAWALVAAAMAWATRSLPCATAVVPLAVAWSFGEMDANPERASVVAYLLTLGLGGLAYRFQNGVVAGFAAIGTLAGLMFAGAGSSGDASMYYAPLALSAALLALSLHEGWWSTPLRRVGMGAFIILTYFASFAWAAEDLGISTLSVSSLTQVAVLGLPFLGLATAAAGFRLGRPRPLSPPERAAGATLIAVVALVGASVIGVGMLWLVANLGLAALAGLSIRRAVDELERGPFWLGVSVAGVQILTRFLEFEVGLLIKAAVFTVLGVAVIGIGYTFENRRREVLHAS